MHCPAMVTEGTSSACVLMRLSLLQMNVLLLMLAGSDTSRDAHKVLLGVLPELPPAIMEEVDPSPLRCQCPVSHMLVAASSKLLVLLRLPPGIMQEMSRHVL